MATGDLQGVRRQNLRMWQPMGVTWLRTRYAGRRTQTHLSELLSERDGIDFVQDHNAAYPGQRWTEQSAAKASE